MAIKRAVAVIMALAVVFAVLFSAFVIIESEGHQCSGEHCRICRILSICRSVLSGFVSAAVLITVVSHICFKKAACARMPFYHNPVALRVKLTI